MGMRVSIACLTLCWKLNEDPISNVKMNVSTLLVVLAFVAFLGSLDVLGRQLLAP